MIAAGAGIVGFSAVRRTSIERAAHATAPATPSAVPATPVTATATPSMAPAPPLMPAPEPVMGAVRTVPPTTAPAPPLVHGPARDVARRSPPRSDSHRVPAPARDEAQDADPTAAIDWLLNTSRTKGP
jgi:hypothetical protein